MADFVIKTDDYFCQSVEENQSLQSADKNTNHQSSDHSKNHANFQMLRNRKAKSCRPEKDLYRYFNDGLKKLLQRLGLYSCFQVEMECSQIKQKIQIILYLIRVTLHADSANRVKVKNEMIKILDKKIKASQKKINKDQENREFYLKKIDLLHDLKDIVYIISELDSIPSKMIRRMLILKLINQNTNINNYGSKQRQANLIQSAYLYLDQQLNRDEKGQISIDQIKITAEYGVQTNLQTMESEESIFEVLEFKSCHGFGQNI